eukprot:scaffold14967_cov21-Tisochrysis_lutea.AAC.1
MKLDAKDMKMRLDANLAAHVGGGCVPKIWHKHACMHCGASAPGTHIKHDTVQPRTGTMPFSTTSEETTISSSLPRKHDDKHP